MGTTPAPGVVPEYDELVENVTGETPHDNKPEPIEVRVIHAVRTETLPPRTVLADQVGVGVLPVRLVGEQRTRATVTLRPSVDTFIGGPGVTPGTGFLAAADTVLTLTTTDALYGVLAAGDGTVYTLTTLHEG